MGVTNAEQLTIGVIGDYGAAYAGGASLSNVQAVVNLIESWKPDLIITTGDNNYPDGEASNIDTNIGQFFHHYIHPYVGTFGPGGPPTAFGLASAITNGHSASRAWPLIWPTSLSRETNVTTTIVMGRWSFSPVSGTRRSPMGQCRFPSRQCG
jgi:hypothetical protein